MSKQTSNLTHDTVPATVGLVKEVRDELRADIRSVDYKIDSLDQKLGSLDHKIEAVDQKVKSLDHKIEAVDHKVESLRGDLKATEYRLDSKIEQVIVSVHRTQVLMEEQRGENRIVLDGIKSLFEKYDRVETDIVELRNTVKTLSAGAKS